MQGCYVDYIWKTYTQQPIKSVPNNKNINSPQKRKKQIQIQNAVRDLKSKGKSGRIRESPYTHISSRGVQKKKKWCHSDLGPLGRGQIPPPK